MNIRAPTSLAVAFLAFLLAGCGEKAQVTVYKQGTYQGKPDSLPWESTPFNGNKVEWEKAIDGRTKQQNEYLRAAQ